MQGIVVEFLVRRLLTVKQILCLSNEPWSTSPGRTQQLISRLKDTQILYFAPAASRTDRSYLKPGRKVRPNVTVYTLPPLLLPLEEEHTPRLFRAARAKLGRFVASKAARHRFRAPLLWATSPEHVHLLDHLTYDGLIYDCDREWDDLPLIWEGSLANAADVVFAASQVLVDRLTPCSPNVALLLNGVNYPLFADESGAPRVDPMPWVNGPILGWTGTIREDLDLRPLFYTALDHPEWTFLLLGPVEGNPLLSRLRRLPNVIFGDACMLSEVPDWLHRCSVLLDFLRSDRADDGVISSRLYEYLCTGKPIVTMLWPDQVEQFPDVVYAAHDEQEFSTLCAHALEESAGLAARRRKHGAAAAWPLRAAEVARILETAGLL